MMEFTLSRVAMCACAVLLMAAVAGPVTGVFEDRQEEMYAHAGGEVKDVIDSFSQGPADSMVLDMALYLPSDTSVSFSGNVMTLETSEGSYSYYTESEVDCSGPLDCCDLAEVTKTVTGLKISSLAQSEETL